MGKANNLLYHATKFSNANKKVLKHNYYLDELGLLTSLGLIAWNASLNE